jgi:hypothetical protein
MTMIRPAMIYSVECWAIKKIIHSEYECSQNEDVALDMWPYKKRLNKK